jgi:hypothetical protein
VFLLNLSSQIWILPKNSLVLTQTEREHSLRRMDIDVMKNFEVDEDGNAIKETRMISMRDIRDVLTDWKKILTVVFNILATLPVSAFGTFLPLIVKGKLLL